jgi:outer membrane lipoprotein SlyB
VTGQRSRRRTDTAVAALLCAALAFPAGAQSITIPDFRRPDPPISSVSPGACNACGQILSIREITVDRKPNVPTAFQGDGASASAGPHERNLVGAVMYLPLSQSSTSQPFIGGVGTAEMKQRFQETTFDITVRLDDGSFHRLQRADGTRYRVGDRVRLQGVQLELVAG